MLSTRHLEAAGSTCFLRARTAGLEERNCQGKQVVEVFSHSHQHTKGPECVGTCVEVFCFREFPKAQEGHWLFFSFLFIFVILFV